MEYMSVVQAAKELGLLPFDIHQLIRSGELTAEKPRRKWQVTRSSLEAFKNATQSSELPKTGFTEVTFKIPNSLNRSLQGLVSEAELVLNFNQGFRRRTIVRIDGGGGNDKDINWLIEQQYGFLVKVTHWKRVAKLVASVTTWLTDPQDQRRQAGWVEAPFAYDQPTRQLAVRCQGKDGKVAFDYLGL